MAKVLVLYYSSFGHIEKMAEAMAEGRRGMSILRDECQNPMWKDLLSTMPIVFWLGDPISVTIGLSAASPISLSNLS